MDNDGQDEVFAGYALIDHDGKVQFDHHQGLDPQVVTRLAVGVEVILRRKLGFLQLKIRGFLIGLRLMVF